MGFSFTFITFDTFKQHTFVVFDTLPDNMLNDVESRIIPWYFCHLMAMPIISNSREGGTISISFEISKSEMYILFYKIFIYLLKWPLVVTINIKLYIVF